MYQVIESDRFLSPSCEVTIRHLKGSLVFRNHPKTVIRIARSRFQLFSSKSPGNTPSTYKTMDFFKQRFAHPSRFWHLSWTYLLVQKDPGPALEQKDENAFKELSEGIKQFDWPSFSPKKNPWDVIFVAPSTFWFKQKLQLQDEWIMKLWPFSNFWRVRLLFLRCPNFPVRNLPEARKKHVESRLLGVASAPGWVDRKSVV